LVNGEMGKFIIGMDEFVIEMNEFIS